jgi:RPN1 N-terminal domain
VFEESSIEQMVTYFLLACPRIPCKRCHPSNFAHVFDAQAFEIYLKFKAFPDALRVALRSGDRGLQQRAFATCDDFAVKQQLCYILARQVWLEMAIAAYVQERFMI